jgi:hypothetical protein
MSPFDDILVVDTNIKQKLDQFFLPTTTNPPPLISLDGVLSSTGGSDLHLNMSKFPVYLLVSFSKQSGWYIKDIQTNSVIVASPRQVSSLLLNATSNKQIWLRAVGWNGKRVTVAYQYTPPLKFQPLLQKKSSFIDLTLPILRLQLKNSCNAEILEDLLAQQCSHRGQPPSFPILEVALVENSKQVFEIESYFVRVGKTRPNFHVTCFQILRLIATNINLASVTQLIDKKLRHAAKKRDLFLKNTHNKKQKKCKP